MEPYISLITLGVSDLVRSTAFYKQGLGLPTKEEFDGVTFLNLRGTWLALYPREALAADAQVSATGNGFPGFTLAHNVKSKEAVDRILQQAEAAGATILKPAQDIIGEGILATLLTQMATYGKSPGIPISI